MNYCPVWILVQSGHTTESDAYEPIVQSAQVGSKSRVVNVNWAKIWESHFGPYDPESVI